jgi:hypothetical protein
VSFSHGGLLHGVYSDDNDVADNGKMDDLKK